MTLRQFRSSILGKRKLGMAIKKLEEKNSCYVLITCGDPNDEGKMSVEMSYEGDIDLAALLIDQASTIIHGERDEHDATMSNS